MCYLRKLFFYGSRLCQGMLLSFLLGGFLQEGTQQQTSFQGTFWLIQAGQEDAQAHFGSFQSSTKLCLFWGLLQKPWPIYSGVIFCNITKERFSFTCWWILQCYFLSTGLSSRLWSTLLAFVVAFLGREGFIVIPPTKKASARVQSQEDVQAHFGSFQSSIQLCLFWGLLQKPWPILYRVIFCNNTLKGFSNT